MVVVLVEGGGCIAECRKIGRRRRRVGSGVMDGWVEVGGVIEMVVQYNHGACLRQARQRLHSGNSGCPGLARPSSPPWPGPAPLLPATQSESFCSGPGLF